MIKPSSFEDTKTRMGDFFLKYMKSILGDKSLIESSPEQITELFSQFIADATYMIGEADRLRKVLTDLMQQHLPHPGEPGAPVICGYCSLNGSHIAWPCATYTAAQKGLEGNKG